MLPVEITPVEVSKLRADGQDFILLDCREPDEAVVASIAGAMLVPMGQIADRVGELGDDFQRRIVVHCHKGGRSYRAANWLRQQGFENAQSMAGGIDQWAVEIEPGMARY